MKSFHFWMYVVCMQLQAGCSIELKGKSTSPEPFVMIRTGELPIIIGVPHDGQVLPSNIPDRAYGTMTNDYSTYEMAWLIYDELENLTGQHPHLVINNLARIKMDANREIEEAAQGNVIAETTWNEYHVAIDAAREDVTQMHVAGLFVDLHGHGHEIQRIELGYLTQGSELRLSDEELDTGTNCNGGQALCN